MIKARIGVLGSIVLLPAALTDVAMILRPDDFYDDAHAKIFAAMKAIQGERKPLDPTLLIEFPTSGGLPAIPHLHGGFNLPQFDGTPFQWWNDVGQHGSHYVTNVFTYGNQQRAANLWYHDHAVGVTRFNPFCGLAGYYLLRDDVDTGLDGNPLGLPAGPYEVPLVIQDRIFNPDGSLFYSAPNNGVQAINPADQLLLNTTIFLPRLKRPARLAHSSSARRRMYGAWWSICAGSARGR